MTSRPCLAVAHEYDPTSDVVRTIMVIGAAIVLLVVQYRTRARARAVAIGVAGVADRIDRRQRLVVAVIGTKGRSADVGHRSGDAAVFRSRRYGAASTWTFLTSTPCRRRGRLLALASRLSDIAPGWSADISVREASIRADGGRTLTSRVRGYRANVGIDDVEERAESTCHSPPARRRPHCRWITGG